LIACTEWWFRSNRVTLICLVIVVVKRPSLVELGLIERFESCGVVRLRLDVRNHREFAPGAFAFLNCPKISSFEWHPFAVSRVENSLIEFEILQVGGPGSWTRKLFALSSTSSTSSFETSVNKLIDENTQLMFEESALSFKVDGPYFSGIRSSSDLRSYDCVVFVAGGIGLTSIKPLFRCFPSEKQFRFSFLFRNRESLTMNEDFFEGVSDHQRDRFMFFQTLEDQVGEVVSNSWPSNAILSRGVRPSPKAVLGENMDRAENCVCCVCGPEELTEAVMLEAQSRGYEILRLSYSM
jgi:NAD(P)H-flavin reductase